MASRARSENWYGIAAQENKEIYKILVCFSNPRKEVDQEDNMDDRVDQNINIWNVKTGSIE